MATISQLIERLQKLNESVPQIIANSIEQTKESFLALNASQLADGNSSNGKTTLDGSDFYRPSTVRRKKKYGVGLGSVTDHITLYDSGQMHRSESLTVDGGKIVTDFNTDYSEFVLARTGTDVLALNPENKATYIFGDMFQAVKNQVEEITQLTMQ